MKVKRKNQLASLVVLSSCFLAGCQYQSSKNGKGSEGEQTSFSSMEVQGLDSVTLTKFNYQLEGGELEKARVHASQLSCPEGRAIAFLRVVLKGKETIENSTCKKEALNEAIQNLNSISNLEVKFALQQEFLTALFDLDPKHKQKSLTEIYTGVLDNFWETATALDSNVVKLKAATISNINQALNKSWTLETSHLKKLGLEGKLHTAKLRYPLNPEKAHTEMTTIKDQIWEINPPAARIPFLLDLIEFELDVTHDLSEAKRLITTLKKTIEMEAKVQG
ncbi:MAG: hypothetical protein KDK64_00875 [Chlamydiia bacterium]|nr:hypothetical protein [Chlamydiia bacterium]